MFGLNNTPKSLSEEIQRTEQVMEQASQKAAASKENALGLFRQAKMEAEAAASAIENENVAIAAHLENMEFHRQANAEEAQGLRNFAMNIENMFALPEVEADQNKSKVDPESDGDK